MNKDKILKEMELCLLTDEELALGADAWEEFEDPFDDWEIMFESDDEDDDEDMEDEEHDHKNCSHAHHHHGHKH